MARRKTRRSDRLLTGGTQDGPRRDRGAGGGLWLYGRHAVEAALANPRRDVRRLIVLDPAALVVPPGRPAAEIRDRAGIESLLPPGAVHQGLAALVVPLPEVGVEDVCIAASDRPDAIVVVLDQVTDPQNVGAILRSAAAFGAIAVIQQSRHAPPVTGTLAKAASGGLEALMLADAVNIARALDDLRAAGFRTLGLDSEAPQSLATAPLDGRIALVLGAEGAGLRRLVRESCDILARLPTRPPVASLNVSAAAAAALYELARGRRQS